ncbi:phage holin family protein [Natrononativus amylolyticus]|uniref:phage holin family protein n=1 Tax=Natrononativus amylolyticus TaxID=2963434 RepID=UPI0020CE8A93|nr:phage holin family protein [Natrononativus amylolyticus]
MNLSPTDALDQLRQPEYTGENRCIPCTAVNAVIAAVIAGFVAIVSPPLGVLALVLSAAAIYLRGYLVPGTPSLTKQYFPDWLLAKFDKGPAVAGMPEMDDSHGPDPLHEREGALDPERTLLESGVVEPCATEDDLCLADGVREEWRARIAGRRGGDRRQQVADFLESEPDAVEVTTTDDHVVVRHNGRLAARWESDAALLADLGGMDLLATHVPSWEQFDLEDRSQVVNGLRAFVEDCPTCDGTVSIDEETVESCCRSHEVYAVTCEECGARVLEVAQ